jgi:hypothetical protein
VLNIYNLLALNEDDTTASTTKEQKMEGHGPKEEK